MKRFRTHAGVVLVLVVCVVVILLAHSIRIRLEWAAGGFIVGLIAGGIVSLDMRHHRRQKKT